MSVTTFSYHIGSKNQTTHTEKKKEEKKLNK